MDGERYIQRSSWMSEDVPQPRAKRRVPVKPRKKQAAKITLTAAQSRWLLKAWNLRQKLTDRAMAARFGITPNQLQHQLIRVRKGL